MLWNLCFSLCFHGLVSLLPIFIIHATTFSVTIFKVIEQNIANSTIFRGWCTIFWDAHLDFVDYCARITLRAGRTLPIYESLQRAVNRQPGSRARTRRAGDSSLTFSSKKSFFQIFKKILKNCTLLKNFMSIELCARIGVLVCNYLYPKLQYIT